MPSARASRTIAAPLPELWELVRDPHHLPRWWPRVTRVEDVDERAFTEVMLTKKGKVVRADFDVAAVDEAEHVLRWEQRIEGTPFAKVLRSAQTELRLAPANGRGGRTGGGAAADAFGGDAETGLGGPATEVTIELRQEMGSATPDASFTRHLPRLGAWLVRRAAKATVEQALDGLEQING